MVNNGRIYLVGGSEHGWIMTFHSVGNVIIPTDELIFFRGVGLPPTSKVCHDLFQNLSLIMD